MRRTDLWRFPVGVVIVKAATIAGARNAGTAIGPVKK